ncbi:Lipoprotein OS=Streptomyces antimycoticus OX=68175 GN=SANT12839_066660 PE=4 SV=1 [Streptomyces antimycoticus]
MCRAHHKNTRPPPVNGLKRGHRRARLGLHSRVGGPRRAAALRGPPAGGHGLRDQRPGCNGVDWLPEKRKDGYRFTTVLRRAYVEVTVPGKYAPEVNALLDLAKAVKKTVPKGVA